MSGRPPRLRALRPRPPQQQAKSQRMQVEVKSNKDDKISMKYCASEIRNVGDVHEDSCDLKKLAAAAADTVNNDITIARNESNEVKSLQTETVQNYECKMCKPSKFMPSVKVYLEHLKKEHKLKGKHIHEGGGNRCPMCSYVALNLRDLETHQRVHHLKRRFFRCAKCSYVTHVRARYTKHVKYHSMPMIKCDTCDFRTPYKWNLDRHTRNHGGGGAFQCRACNFTADIRQSLTVHETNHHEPPVGQVNRKSNITFERKPRNSPKRYNQVGASDYRELNVSATMGGMDLLVSSNTADKKRNAIASAECIALKCEEKGCQFITAWDSEMQRHLAECHTPSTPSKSKKPLPMLIPLSPMNAQPNNVNVNGPSTTLLKVPRVRVRPELAQIARDTEIAKLYGSKENSNLRKDVTNATDLFEKKNALFFDKLKEKLTTAINTGAPEIAVSSIDELKCWCTYKANTVEELFSHKQTHHTALSVSVGASRCPKCRRRCKSSTDLQVHMQCCHTNKNVGATNSNLEKTGSDFRISSYHSEYSFPSQLGWNMNLGEINSSGSSMEQQSWEDASMEEKSVDDSNTDESPNKLLIMNKKEYLQSSDLAATPVSIHADMNHSTSSLNVSLRPPPPLKAAIRGKGQSLLKSSPVSAIGNNSVMSTTSMPTANTMDEAKRTLWKCKRCNYRDPNKETVLLHVKSHYESLDHNNTNDTRNVFGCGDCPFSATDAASLSIHRMHHRPNLEAIFKCYLCPYYVTTKAELLEHARLHGEELAVVHQQSTDFHSVMSKSKQLLDSSPDSGNIGAKENMMQEQIGHLISQSNSVLNTSKGTPPPLLLDTRALPEPPLVWVSRPDGTLTKMLKCRHCPHVSTRRAEVMDHETMHIDSPSQGPVIACTDCSFSCNRKEVMITHSNMHAGSLGTVHCLVDESRPDAQQVSDLATLLGFKHPPVLGSEPDLRDLRLVHCCGKCPARFLCEKELRIHLRYHTTELAYLCQWCSYAARQQSHLLAHQKAHSTEYQERTKYLLSLYGHSQRYPPPATACVESNSQETNGLPPSIAWIVVEVTNQSSPNQRGNQVFTCAKCPARYFRLDALEYHMTLHGSNNRFKCTECDYSSKTAQNLVKHQVVHRRHNEIKETASGHHLLTIGDPQFGVFIRGNPNFVYPGCLRNGRLKEKRYKCHKCPSAFEKREQYRVHLTLHGAKQRYRCDMCDYSVKYYANYIQHLKKHQANAEAQASRRQFEDDTISVDIDNDACDIMSVSRSGKSLRSSTVILSPVSSVNSFSGTSTTMQASNQDKQSLMIMQKKGLLLASSDTEVETIRCQNCPFSTLDKEAMDAHKRRHGIERMTPSCPHCDYIPRKDENIGEHIRLHFTRLYKPESYLIIELLTLTMKKILSDERNEDPKSAELLFKENPDGRFFPLTDASTMTFANNSQTLNAFSEKVTIDPHTGEAKHHLTV